MNVLQKIHAIMSEVGYIKKDDQVKFGSTNYKALSEEKVTTIMHEKIVQYGLVVYPFKQEFRRDGQISHVDVTYRIVNKDDPSDFIDVVSCGDGADTQDKGSGKAMTYSYKYMWLRVFCLPTGEDPDKISSAQLDAEQAQAAKNPTLDNAAPVQTSPEVALSVAQGIFSAKLRLYCQQKKCSEESVLDWLVETYIKKPVDQFTVDDYKAAQKRIEAAINALGKKQ